MDETNRVTKVVGNKILQIFGKIQTEISKLKLKSAYLQGRLDERVEVIEKMTNKDSYAEKLKSSMLKVGDRELTPRSTGNVLLLYPTGKSQNSEETKQAIKKAFEPHYK